MRHDWCGKKCFWSCRCCPSSRTYFDYIYNYSHYHNSYSSLHCIVYCFFASSMLLLTAIAHWTTQHLHLSFFLMITSSTLVHSFAWTTIRFTSTSPPATVFPLGVPLLRWLVELTVDLLVPLAAKGGACEGEDALVPVPGFEVVPFFGLVTARSGVKDCFVGLVGVIGFPSLIRLTIASASRLMWPPGRKGLSTPSSIASQCGNASVLSQC